MAKEAQVTIPVGDTKSTVLNLIDDRLVGFSLPATLDGTALTFEGGISEGARDMFIDPTDGTFFALYNSSGAVSLTVAASRHYTLDPDALEGVMWLKFVMGTNQATTDTVITCILEPR